jgi:hypothetical protein
VRDDTGLKAGVNEKRALTLDAGHELAATLAKHTLTRQSFETEREQILQRPIIVDLHPTSAAPWSRCGIQHRRDVAAAFNEKDFRVRLQPVPGVGKIRAQRRNRNPRLMPRSRDKFISSRVEMQTRKSKVEHFVATRLMVAGVGTIAKSYSRDHLVSEMVALDLMKNRVAVSEGVSVIWANDFEALSMDIRNCEDEHSQTGQEFHPSDFRTNSFSRKRNPR